MRGTHYKAIDLQEICAAVRKAQAKEMPLDPIFVELGERLGRTANAIQIVARQRGFTVIAKGRKLAHSIGVDDDETINANFEQVHRVACRAADAVFQERMHKAIARGCEQAPTGVSREPCTVSPRALRADPLIYIRSSSDFIGVDTVEA